MKILSIETTSEVCSVAFLENEKICSEYFFRTSDAASRLISYIEIILRENSCPPQAVDTVVVSYGPGLWTGIRLGMGVAKGIVAGTGGEIFCVGTMDSIFFGIKEFRIPAFCIINAYQGNLYVSYFNGNFTYKKNYPVRVISVNKFYRMCEDKNVLITGPGISVVFNKVRRLKNIRVIERFSYPSAGINGLLALEKIHRGIPSAPLKPLYGR